MIEIITKQTNLKEMVTFLQSFQCEFLRLTLVAVWRLFQLNQLWLLIPSLSSLCFSSYYNYSCCWCAVSSRRQAVVCGFLNSLSLVFTDFLMLSHYGDSNSQTNEMQFDLRFMFIWSERTELSDRHSLFKNIESFYPPNKHIKVRTHTLGASGFLGNLLWCVLYMVYGLWYIVFILFLHICGIYIWMNFSQFK